MGLVIEIVAAIRNDMIFVLTRFERNAIGGFLEKIDGRRRIEGKHRGPHRCGEPRIDLVEGEQDVDRLRLDLRQHLIEAGEIATEKLARKDKEFAQQVETFEHPMIVRKQRILAFKSDLPQAVRGAG